MLPAEKAVEKVTGLPARRLRLAGKGAIAPGMDADLNVFTLEGLHEAATYAQPQRTAEGMDAARFQAVRPGQVWTGPAA